jgi:hypothetical protein
MIPQEPQETAAGRTPRPAAGSPAQAVMPNVLVAPSTGADQG